MNIYGTEAELIADLSEGTIEVNYLHPKTKCVYKVDNNNTGHSGGDAGLFKALIDSILMFDSTKKINQMKNGTISSLIALAGEDCMKDKKVVDVRVYNV
jgi:hypothetical protein